MIQASSALSLFPRQSAATVIKPAAAQSQNSLKSSQPQSGKSAGPRRALGDITNNGGAKNPSGSVIKSSALKFNAQPTAPLVKIHQTIKIATKEFVLADDIEIENGHANCQCHAANYREHSNSNEFESEEISMDFNNRKELLDSELGKISESTGAGEQVPDAEWADLLSDMKADLDDFDF